MSFPCLQQRTRPPKQPRSILPVILSHFGRRRSGPNCSEPISLAALPMAGSAGVSDVDMALVTEAGVSAQTLDRVRSEATALSADWGPKLSVFWDRPTVLSRPIPSTGSHRLYRSCGRAH